MNIHLFQTLCYFLGVYWFLVSVHYPVYGNFTESFLTGNVSATKAHGKLRRSLATSVVFSITSPDARVCESSTLTWTISNPSPISANTGVTVSFILLDPWLKADFSNAEISNGFTFSAQFTEYVQVKNSQQCTLCSFTISKIQLPSLITLTSKLTISGYTDGTNTITIAPITSSNGKVDGVSKLLATEVGNYKIELQKQCNNMLDVDYTINIPSIFKSPSNGNQITGTLSRWPSNELTVIQFSLQNPPSKRDSTDFANQIFKIIVSKNAESLLEMSATYSGIISPGIIQTVSVKPTEPNAGDHCKYNFIINIPHPIPAGGRIRIELDPAVKSSSSYGLEPTDRFETPIISNNEIIAKFKNAVSIGNLEVTVLNVVNPVFTGTYNQCKVTTYEDDNLNHIIDESAPFLLEINQYGSGQLSCTSDNKVNLATAKYTCIFESMFIPIPYTINPGDMNILDILLPTELADCAFDSLISIASIVRISAIKYEIRIPITNTITIPFTCKNPSSTRPTSGFQVTLSYPSTLSNKILIQKSVPLKTDIGAKLKTCNLISDDDCPSCKTSCEIVIEQPEEKKINYILMKSPLINSVSGCRVNGALTNCEYSTGEVFVTVMASSSGAVYTIKLPSVTNPNTAGSENGQFSIITYEDKEKQYIINEGVLETGGTTRACFLEVRCNFPCKECETGEPAKCTTCAPDHLLDGIFCVTSCPSGKIASGELCVKCDPDCLECAKSKDYCTICANDRFLSDGKCFDSCPRQTTEPTSGKTCVACGTGCDVCDKGNPSACITCTIGYKYLNFLCYRACPNNYIASDDGFECIKGGSSSGQFFPHLITVVLLGIITAAGQSRDGRAMMISNLVVVINYVAISSYIVQIAYGLKESESLAAIVTIAIVLIQIILNFLFCIPYNKYMKKDVGFGSWVKANTCAHRIILTLSTIFTFQTERFFYSRFLGFDLFFAKFVDFGSLIKPLNYFSITQIIVVQFPVIIIDIVELTKLTWGTTLYTTLIESLVLSLLLLILIAYEIKNVQATQLYLTQSTDEYSKLNDNSMSNQFTGYSSKPLDEERLRKEIFDEVFQKISITLRPPRSDKFQRSERKLERRQSYSKETDYFKEKDPRKCRSYPCSPKTAKEKEIPFKKYKLYEDKVVPLDRLPDNVLADAMPPKKGRMVVPMNDLGMQTIPFEKIEIFRKHMNLKGGKKRKMFEQTPNPLAAIPEKYEDEDEERKRKIEEAKRMNNQLMSEESYLNSGGKARQRGNNNAEGDTPDGENNNNQADEIINESSSKRPGRNKAIIPLVIPVGGKGGNEVKPEEDKSKKFPFIKRPNSPPQQLDEESDRVISKPLQPIDGDKERASGMLANDSAKNSLRTKKTLITHNEIPEIFADDNNGFVYSSSRIKQPPIKAERALPDKSVTMCISDNDIRGEFNTDSNGYLLIMESLDGTLIDLKGRAVNKYGYLIDKDGNVVNQEGVMVMLKAEFDKAIEEDGEDPRPIVQNDTLIKRPELNEQSPQNVDTIEEVKKDLSERADTLDNKLEERKSVSLDLSMEDTPSNYNELNQRFETQMETINHQKPLLEKQQPPSQVLKKTPNPPLRDSELARVYREKPISMAKKPGKNRGNNKSVNKKGMERAFQEVERPKISANTSPKPSIEKAKPESSTILKEKAKTAHGTFRDSEEFEDNKKAIDGMISKVDAAQPKFINFLDELSSEEEKSPKYLHMLSLRSKTPTNWDKIRGLESIYLQRLESSTKKKNLRARRRRKHRRMKKDGSEPDEIEVLLEANYNGQKRKFQQLQNSESRFRIENSSNAFDTKNNN